MGDRTQVVLLVLLEHADVVRAIYKNEFEESWLGDTLATFTFQEINYGTLHDLIKLQEMGIPYNSVWSAGDDYDEGGEYLRFTPEGDICYKELYVSDENPPLNKLLELLDSPEKLREFILTFKEKVSILPWDNQEEYGKIYRAKQLICKE